MKKLLVTAALAATVATLSACSGNDAADNATANETALTNDDFSSAQENLTVTDDLSGNGAALDNLGDAAANDSALNASAGNTL